MSLSVNNTGYSNSQAQSTATSSNTARSTTAEPTAASSDITHIIDPITGKTTLTFPSNINITTEAIARLKKNGGTPPPPSVTKIDENMQREEVQAIDLERQKNTTDPSLNIKLSVNDVETNKMALEGWSNNLKAGSDISKEGFVSLINQALSRPFGVTLWNYTTDSMEITIKAAKLEELKNRYVDSRAHQQADKDIQDFIQYQSDALSNVEKNILQDEYQRSVDAGDTDEASSTFLELQKNAEGTSATQVQRQQIFSLAASSDSDTLFSRFRHYISVTSPDRYTKSEYTSILNQFDSHWLEFQLALK
ncbi:hypothetical protein IG605_002335 [Pectobacterium quasiaquaticum]|uniref:Uncharacterized protein n=1 Tax=Pectobacterium quasiaquaticum TaxID=2774015 RepID=A0A9Q2EQX5_9GAMM|nr:hypothetical protein [Pectobacterium quasiaquaticum]MBE5203256.1 hypothetical protein [Pectobacterium quasiaquaticum]MBE5211467.1 hypothetical protein [Pectobacterium quasiaquaticum]MBE5221216.1 hypothetical protein [Pectobacterium quasiaquaticum]URG49472.1 hypothetical protein IG609_002465 [Pectobacterium quasiaquaticum]URG53235.1 hypothetical protein IG605_002335 [Pectobacterium quasiaquaticum]